MILYSHTQTHTIHTHLHTQPHTIHTYAFYKNFKYELTQIHMLLHFCMTMLKFFLGVNKPKC